MLTFLELKKGLQVPAITVANVLVMTDGTVRVYYDDPALDPPVESEEEKPKKKASKEKE